MFGRCFVQGLLLAVLFSKSTFLVYRNPGGFRMFVWNLATALSSSYFWWRSFGPLICWQFFFGLLALPGLEHGDYITLECCWQVLVLALTFTATLAAVTVSGLPPARGEPCPGTCGI